MSVMVQLKNSAAPHKDALLWPDGVVTVTVMVQLNDSAALQKDALLSPDGMVSASVMVQLKEKKNSVPQKNALLGPEMGPVSVSVMALVKENK